MSDFTKAKIIWFVYNHVPGGNVIASHKETYKRKRNLGEGRTEEKEYTAFEQVEGVRKEPQIGLFQNDKFEKNKVLIYPNSTELVGNAQAADVVLAWAEEQGVKQYRPDAKKKAKEEKAAV